MKVQVVPENIKEWFALRLGLLPRPIFETQNSMILAQVIIVANRLNIFDVLSPKSLTVEEIATACCADVNALLKLLNSLVSSGYLRQDGKTYGLTAMTRQWLLKESQPSIKDFIAGRVLPWKWLTHLEEYIRTGVPLQIHQEMSSQEWGLYQKAMRSFSGLASPEMIKYIPILENPQKMLDIGGSHGYNSVLLCNRYPELHSVILELPSAIEYAASILEQESMGERIIYKPGNALTEDLGDNIYDLVLIADLIHHFDEANNIDLFSRVARCLKPGGLMVVQNKKPSRKDGQLGAFLDLFFSMTSNGSNWNFTDISGWQKKVGLAPQKPITIKKIPSLGGLQVASKS